MDDKLFNVQAEIICTRGTWIDDPGRDSSTRDEIGENERA